jgi:hypothetical protein
MFILSNVAVVNEDPLASKTTCSQVRKNRDEVALDRGQLEALD